MQSAESNYQGVWGNRIGFGQRPALLVIDFLKGYTTEGAPLYAPGVVEAVAQTPALIEAAREAGIPSSTRAFSILRKTAPMAACG
jgi:maleamate amidohydrolase